MNKIVFFKQLKKSCGSILKGYPGRRRDAIPLLVFIAASGARDQ